MSRWLLVAVALVAAGLGAGATYLGGLYRPIAAGPERTRIEGVVRDYLIRHPEVLVEASTALRRRESGKAIAADRRAITEPYGNAWSGNPAGDVVVVEYFDYNCGYCRASLPVIDQLVASDAKVRIIYRDWPILSDESATAARYSLVAAEMGRFRQFHEALYAAGPVTDATIQQAVARAGLDLAKVRAAVDTPRIDAELERNLGTAKKLGLSGSPSWVIGDQVVSSALPLEELQRLVAEARAGG
ncbi:MAG: DsbA family protein [Sphingomonas sp.]|uniref:DsbA family protein n=1 Tax=Sphingomonas sp. TaxID=28214 RepID=UPI0017B061FD|nr:disulfide bond formation protein DsbA [Zymomonas sp.]MBA4041956.1 disulfide bond formation protein DsbA [Sphingobium sp.]MBA4773918.1 DsbA family protein [Sphingomonas sp.]